MSKENGFKDAWKKYATDFYYMTDDEIDSEVGRSRSILEEQEEFLEAFASWEAAGRPRET